MDPNTRRLTASIRARYHFCQKMYVGLLEAGEYFDALNYLAEAVALREQNLAIFGDYDPGHVYYYNKLRCEYAYVANHIYSGCQGPLPRVMSDKDLCR